MPAKPTSAKAPEHTCARHVYSNTPSDWGGHGCSRNATLFEDGKWWCSIHAPSIRAQKDKELQAKWDAQRKVREAQYAKDADDRRKLAAHSELVAALQKAIDRLKFDLDLDYGTAKQGQGALPRPLLLEELQAALKKAGAE